MGATGGRGPALGEEKEELEKGWESAASWSDRGLTHNCLIWPWEVWHWPPRPLPVVLPAGIHALGGLCISIGTSWVTSRTLQKW
jgi:hypothetical protein